MDWTAALNVGAPVVALGLGLLAGRRKTKADTHAVVVTNATDFARTVNERYDMLLRRVDELEQREDQRDNLARQHLRWDWRQLRKLADLGIEVEDPPPLFLYPDNLKGTT